MMKSAKLGAMVAVGALVGAAVHAQTAHTTPDQVICAMSGQCGSDGAPGSDQQLKVGQERSFSLVKPTSTMAAPAAATPRAAPGKVRAAAVRRAPAPRPASGRLDMLVTFPLGSAELVGSSRQELQSFATAIASSSLAGMRFNVEGHTDAVGARDYNLTLSKKRADAVVTYLTSLGVDASRLRAEGFGFDKPRTGLAPKAAGNRRVEFVKAS